MRKEPWVVGSMCNSYMRVVVEWKVEERSIDFVVEIEVEVVEPELVDTDTPTAAAPAAVVAVAADASTGQVHNTHSTQPSQQTSA